MCSGLAKFVPTEVSESIVAVDAAERVFRDKWYRIQKYENHDVVVLLRGKALGYESFRVLPNNELSLYHIYRDANHKEVSQRIKEAPQFIYNNSILIQVTDDRPFETFKKERAEKLPKKFQIDIELMDKTKSKLFKFSLILDDVNAKAKTLREKSFMYNWYFGSSGK